MSKEKKLKTEKKDVTEKKEEKKAPRKFVWREAYVNKELLNKKMKEKGYEVVEPKQYSKCGNLVLCKRKHYLS